MATVRLLAGVLQVSAVLNRRPQRWLHIDEGRVDATALQKLEEHRQTGPTRPLEPGEPLSIHWFDSVHDERPPPRNLNSHQVVRPCDQLRSLGVGSVETLDGVHEVQRATRRERNVHSWGPLSKARRPHATREVVDDQDERALTDVREVSAIGLVRGERRPGRQPH